MMVVPADGGHPDSLSLETTTMTDLRAETMMLESIRAAMTIKISEAIEVTSDPTVTQQMNGDLHEASELLGTLLNARRQVGNALRALHSHGLENSKI